MLASGRASTLINHAIHHRDAQVYWESCWWGAQIPHSSFGYKIVSRATVDQASDGNIVALRRDNKNAMLTTALVIVCRRKANFFYSPCQAILSLWVAASGCGLGLTGGCRLGRFPADEDGCE